MSELQLVERPSGPIQQVCPSEQGQAVSSMSIDALIIEEFGCPWNIWAWYQLLAKRNAS